jgi:putative DNA primase/helicase
VKVIQGVDEMDNEGDKGQSVDELGLLWTEFMARAAALPEGPGMATDTLVADISGSIMSESAFKPLAAAIAKATKLDATVLSKQLFNGRHAGSEGKDGAAGGAAIAANPAPAPQPRPLDWVADKMVQLVQRQVQLSQSECIAAVLWTVGTYGFHRASIYPRLAITSPTKRCGKSTLLGTLKQMASRPLGCDGISTSAFFRIVAACRPTLMIDEVDTFLKQDEGLRGVLNSGHARNGCIVRSEASPDGKTWVPTTFNTFAPVALSGIGGLPDTVIDRSLVISLQRAPKGGRPSLQFEELETVRALIAPLLVAHETSIAAAIASGVKPEAMPAALDARQRDNWLPLLAVADLLGGHWPGSARAAALALSGGRDHQTHIDMLLEDITGYVAARRADAAAQLGLWRNGGRRGPRPAKFQVVGSTDLVGHLNELEHRPWPSYGKSTNGITPPKLADMLRRFKIKPQQRRVPAALGLGLGGPSTKPTRTYTVQELRKVCRQYL